MKKLLTLIFVLTFSLLTFSLSGWRTVLAQANGYGSDETTHTSLMAINRGISVEAREYLRSIQNSSFDVKQTTAPALEKLASNVLTENFQPLYSVIEAKLKPEEDTLSFSIKDNGSPQGRVESKHIANEIHAAGFKVEG